MSDRMPPEVTSIFGSLSAVDVLRRTLLPLAFVALIVLVVLGLELSTYAIGIAFGLSLDVSVWGTYAAWTSAILPTVAVVATIGVWLIGQLDKETRDAQNEAILVTLEQAEGAVASLLSKSSWPVEVIETSPPIDTVVGRIVKPNGPRLLLGQDTISVKFRVRGVEFEQDVAGAIRRLPAPRRRLT